MSSYIAGLKQIGQLLLLPYRNFLHWNLSKVVLFLYANISAGVLSIPLILLGYLLARPIMAELKTEQIAQFVQAGTIDPSIIGIVGNHIGAILAIILLFVLVISLFIFTYTYSYFLIQRVHKGYTEGVRLPIRENWYFSWKHIKTFFGILGWTGLYLLIPFILFIAWIGVILFMIGMFMAPSFLGDGKPNVEEISRMVIIAWPTFIWFWITIGLFFYISIRVVFAYIAAVFESGDLQTGKFYTHESFRITKGKFWKIIFLLAPFFIVLSIFGGITSSIEADIQSNAIYDKIVAEQIQTKQSDQEIVHTMLDPYLDRDALKEVIALEKDFTAQKNGVDRKYVTTMIPYLDQDKVPAKNSWFESIFGIVTFFLLEGITQMLYLAVFLVIREKQGEAEIAEELVNSTENKKEAEGDE